MLYVNYTGIKTKQNKTKQTKQNKKHFYLTKKDVRKMLIKGSSV